MANDTGMFRKEAARLIRMREEDLALRQSLLDAGELLDGYHPRMEAMHRSHAESLREIIARIGYPTVRKVGADASNAAWLIVQHAIGEPDFMREICARLRSLAPEDADPRNAAFLEDRIRMYEGRPQLYGTQFDFDDSGVLSPVPFDDREAVNRRRAALGDPPCTGRGLGSAAGGTETLSCRLPQMACGDRMAAELNRQFCSARCFASMASRRGFPLMISSFTA